MTSLLTNHIYRDRRFLFQYLIMVLSPPTFVSLKSIETLTVREIDNINHYLHQLNQTISHLDRDRYSHHASSLTQLKYTLTCLEVDYIKHTAIQQGLWDFYPTSNRVINKMSELAQLQSYHHVLEPLAGSGDLAKAITQVGVNRINCFELHPLLQKALKLQDFNLLSDDFLASSPQSTYDRVLANPPFGNNGVARHTQHAFQFLKPGSKLITLAHHYQLKPSNSDKQFFAWLKKHNAKFLNIGTAFQNSDRKTNVPLQLILIHQP